MEDVAIELAFLLMKKFELEKQLKKTFKCFLRKCFSCLGMKIIEEELRMINEKLFELKVPSIPKDKKLKRISSI